MADRRWLCHQEVHKNVNFFSHLNQNNMYLIENFKDAFLKNFANFSGRARRKQYWNFVLMSMIILVPLYLIFMSSLMSIEDGLSTFDSSILSLMWLIYLVLFVPSLAIAVRRLHDTNRSGWWVLIAFVPVIGSIVLLVFLVSDSYPQTNKWGENPKANEIENF